MAEEEKENQENQQEAPVETTEGGSKESEEVAQKGEEETNTAQAKTPEEVHSPAKKKKISQMNLSEIEAALKRVTDKMGGAASHYAIQLLKRKAVLDTDTK